MLAKLSEDAPTERAKRAECVRTAYLLLTYYLLNLRGMCVFSDTCLALAWYALGIFYLTPAAIKRQLRETGNEAYGLTVELP